MFNRFLTTTWRTLYWSNISYCVVRCCCALYVAILSYFTDRIKMVVARLLSLLLLVTICTSQGYAVSKLVMETSPVKDFGSFISSNRQTAIFTIKNIGEEPLIIKQIRKTCGCTVIKSFDSILQPKETSDIVVQIVPNSIKGLFSKKVFVITNDPKRPIIELTLKGNSVPRVVVSPSDRVYGDRLVLGKRVVYRYLLKKTDKTIDFKSPTVDCNYPAEVSLTDLDDDSVIVYLSVTPVEQKGRLNAVVNIPTNDNRCDDIHLYARADVGPALYAIPSKIKLPRNSNVYETNLIIKFAGFDESKIDPTKLALIPVDGVKATVGAKKGSYVIINLKINSKAINQETKSFTITYPPKLSVKCKLSL